MTTIRLIAFFTLSLSAVFSLNADDEIFARQGDQVLTHGELDAAFAQVPPEHRLPFIRDGEKVDMLIQRLFRYKQMSADARKNGFDAEPMVQERIKLATEEELAKAWLQNIEENVPEADYEQLAKEYYLAHHDEFLSAESVDVSHILIMSSSRPEAEALEMVTRLHAELIGNPSLFDEYILEYSEDPAKSSNDGRYPKVTHGQMVEPFEEMAFSMQEVGSISQPVKTTYGYHIIRLNGRQEPSPVPYELVEPKLIQQVWADHVERYRRNYVLRISDGPISLEEGAVQKMAKRYFGEDLERSPDYYKQ